MKKIFFIPKKKMSCLVIFKIKNFFPFSQTKIIKLLNFKKKKNLREFLEKFLKKKFSQYTY